MTDDQHAHARTLREAHELGGAFLELGDRAGRRPQGLQLDGLDGVDDQQLHGLVTRALHGRFQIRVGHHAQALAGNTEAPGPNADLRRRFLGRKIEGGRKSGGVIRHLQQQRGLADARFAA
jgi:hypothetical protein